MMGGALGLAVLVASPRARTATSPAAGADPVEALNGGFQRRSRPVRSAAFGAAVVGGVFLRPKPMGGMDAHGAPVEEPERRPAAEEVAEARSAGGGTSARARQTPHRPTPPDRRIRGRRCSGRAVRTRGGGAAAAVRGRAGAAPCRCRGRSACCPC